MMRFNLFWDVKVAGVASIYKFSCRSVRMYTATKSFERFRQPRREEGSQKVWRMRRKVLIMHYRNQQLLKPNDRLRFSRNGNRIDLWSPVHLYFGTRRPFYHERLWRSTNFGHGYSYVCMQCQLLAVEVRSRSKQFFWGALSFPFVVLNYLRTEAPSSGL